MWTSFSPPVRNYPDPENYCKSNPFPLFQFQRTIPIIEPSLRKFFLLIISISQGIYVSKLKISFFQLSILGKFDIQ